MSGVPEHAGTLWLGTDKRAMRGAGQADSAMTLDAIRLIMTVLAGGLAIELSIRVLARVHPESYFGLSELIRGLDRDLSWRGFILRLVIPLVAGAVVGLLNPEARIAAGAASAGLGALLVIWPPLIHDHLLPHGTHQHKNAVRVIYVLYLIAFLLLGLVGGAVAGLAMEKLGPSGIAQWFAEAEVPTLTQILAGVIAMPLGTGALLAVKWLVVQLRKCRE